MILDHIRRWRWPLAVAALLAMGLAFAFWPEAKPVDLGKVVRGPMSVGVTDDGVTRAEEYYVVSAPVTGYLQRIELEAGDRVSRGTLITRMAGQPATPLDKRTREELRGELAAARAAEAGAASSLKQARRDLARAEELAQRGFLSRSQLEAARTRVLMDQAALARASGQVRSNQAMLAETGVATPGASVEVRAPASGSVLSVITESEGVIAQGTPLMTIGDPHKIEVVVDLLSREAVRVKPGDRVEITEWGGPKPLIGKVKHVEPFGRLKISALGIEEQRVNVIIAFDETAAQAAAKLGHGYQIDATIVLWSTEDALRVPIGALFRSEDGGWRVFADGNGRAELRSIRIGHMNDEYGEVLGGLAEGEQVVLNPGHALAEGDKIRGR